MIASSNKIPISNFKFQKNMRTIPFRQALREALQEEMRRDEKVFLMGEEVADRKSVV